MALLYVPYNPQLEFGKASGSCLQKRNRCGETENMKKTRAIGSNKSKAVPPYKNAKLPSAQRVKDLLRRMTIEDKAAQMVCVWREKADKLVDAEGNFDYTKAKAAFSNGCAPGQVVRPSEAGNGKNARGMAELTNAIQKFL
jgi:hypothetical protein